MNELRFVRLPRLDELDAARSKFLDEARRAVCPDVLFVLYAALWPPGDLEPRWVEWLLEATATVFNLAGSPPLLAELPTDLYEAIRARRSQEIGGVTCGIMDQTFVRDRPLDTTLLRRVRRELDKRAPGWIAEQLEVLGMVVPGHVRLPGGLHTDKDVKFGSFHRVRGGDGLRNYMTAVMARRIARYNPGVLFYWAGERHTTLPRMVREVRAHLARVGKRVEIVRVTGTYEEPLLDGQLVPTADSGHTTVLLTDILGTGSLARRVKSAAGRAHLYADVIAPFVTFSWSTAIEELKNLPRVRVIPPAVVNAQSWDPDRCPLDGDARPTHSESRIEPPVFDPEEYQPAKGLLWSTIILGGRVGVGSADEDYRHLHDTYLRPSLRPEHLDVVLEEVFRQLAELQFDGVVYHENEASAAVAGRIKARFPDRHIATYPVRRERGEWVIPNTGGSSAGASDRSGFVALDDGVNTGTSLNRLVHLLSGRGARVVAAVVFEDKLDPPARHFLRTTWEVVGWDGVQTRLFFLHRSAPMRASLLEGGCETCDFRAAIRLLARRRRRRPLFVRMAYEELLAETVWPPADLHLTRSQKLPLDVDHTYPMSTQLNRLLQLHEQELTEHSRMMDAIVKDTLPQLRFQGLSGALADLDDRWLERVLLWLESGDLESIRGADLHSRSHRASLAIGELGRARTVADFEQALRETVDLLDADASLGERRYADVTEHVCRAIVRRRGQASWLRAAVNTTAQANSVPLKTLHEELVALGVQLPFRPGSPSGKLRAFVVPDEVFVENVDREMLGPYRRGEGWLLDLASASCELIAGGLPHELDALTGITLALAVLEKRLFTSEATRFYEEALGLPRSRGKHHFETICRRTTNPPGSYVVASGKEVRNTPGHRAENCLRAVHHAGVLVWRDDNTQPWATLTRLARRLQS